MEYEYTDWESLVSEPELRRTDLIHPDLSYVLIGIAFAVHNELGSGHLEKIYQRAFAKELGAKNLKYQEQYQYDVYYKGESIGKSFLDFLVENKVIIELKRNDKYSAKNIEQVSNYLKVSGLQLAILIHFGADGVKFKRIVNAKN
ncbi:MAG: GxxExxY protein [Bacteroidia bacterium]